MSLFKLPPPLLESPLPAAGWSVVTGAAAGSYSYMVHMFLDFMSYPTPSYLTESIHMKMLKNGSKYCSPLSPEQMRQEAVAAAEVDECGAAAG